MPRGEHVHVRAALGEVGVVPNCSAHQHIHIDRHSSAGRGLVDAAIDLCGSANQHGGAQPS